MNNCSNLKLETLWVNQLAHMHEALESGIVDDVPAFFKLKLQGVTKRKCQLG
jgi:hypothetical protein